MPTPENEIVVNKNDGKLTEIIESTDVNEEVQIFQSDPIDRYQNSFVTNDNKVNIKIDAEITLPNTNKLPVAYISPMDISQNFANKVIETLIGDSILYEESSEKTKSQIEKEIESIQFQIENIYPNYEQEEYDYLLDRDQKYLKELFILLESAPDTPSEVASKEFHATDNSEYAGENEPLIESGMLSEEEANEIENNTVQQEQIIEGVVDLGKTDFARIEIYKYSTVNQGIWFKNGNVDEDFFYDKEVDGIDEQQALDIAKNTIENMGISGFALCQNGYAMTYDNGRENKEYAYNFLFKRSVNNVMVSYVDQSKYHSDSIQYAEPWKDESIQIVVDKYGVNYFEYSAPITVVKIANDNVKVMLFDEIMNIFEKQIKIGYAYNQDPHIIEQTIVIDRIELGLSRIARQNNAGYMLVPAWNFYGYEIYTFDEKQPGGWELDENNKVEIKENATSFLTINAIDGSLIDRGLGY